jgi:diacylglycerol kinase family enzyme
MSRATARPTLDQLAQLRRRFVLVRNLAAGVARQSLVERVVAALRRRGASVETALTMSQGEVAGVLAAHTDADAVIAAGGDGTVRGIANALAGRTTPVGVVPAGTGNVLAAEIGLPRTAEGLADVLLSGPTIDVEGGLANGEPFFLMAGAGFDGEVVRRLSGPLKQRLGKAAYVPATLATLVRRQPLLSVAVDGQTHQVGWVVIARARSYAGAFTMARQASLVRPELMAVLFRSASPAVRLAQLAALAVAQHQRLPGVETIACRRVSVRADRPVAVEVDGDAFGATPLEVAFGGPRLRLIVPPAFVAALAHTV